ncbi:bifunctional diguanylate cyclase/phosphodiesterase [Thalassolituus sp. LLYu03]|uniref:bifunctional diguanylate cyclase/phosphodiesterase n=1 Tax=Thalassolituus sp. LLYu03 TaxID=3421656 RepID=UPI003D291064
MTLRQQFSLLTSLLVVVLLAGNLLLTISNGREYFQNQLNARAYDAATSLALSMSQVPADDDVQLQRLMDVLFDRGFFASIELEPVSGAPLHRRSREALASQPAPQWFRDSVSFDLMPAEADVTSGWQRLGTVRVISHPDFAYRDLWNMVRAELIWFAWVLLGALLVMHLLLGWLFRPINRVERQALAICEKDWQVQEDIPRARELQRMVLAMNKMVLKLKSIFSEQSTMTEKLREESFSDTQTGLLNRRGFDERLDHILMRDDEHSGLLVLLQLAEFAAFNQRHGRQAGDDVLALLGRELQQSLVDYGVTLAGRRSGSDFAVYIPATDRTQASEMLQLLHNELQTSVLSKRQGLVFHLGGVFLQGNKSDPVHALSCADAALRQAQRYPESAARLYESSAGGVEWTAGEWRQLLQEALAANAVELLFLPVLSNQDRHLKQFEVFSRLEWQGQVMSAARFWPMVEQHQLTARYDANIVAQVLRLLSKTAPLENVRYCINIAPASVLDESFHQQLQALFSEAPELAAHIALEVPEPALNGIEHALARLAMLLRPYGVGLGVDQVGTGMLAFSYLQRLPLDYIRIDGSFSRGLSAAQDRRFFIQSMVQIAHNLDLQVLGEGVEEGADVEVLSATGVDGLSGYYFCRPMVTLQDAHHWRSHQA